MVTIKELSTDYEECGKFLRRKDASVDNPSPLFTASDVLRMAKDELKAEITKLREERSDILSDLEYLEKDVQECEDKERNAIVLYHDNCMMHERY